MSVLMLAAAPAAQALAPRYASPTGTSAQDCTTPATACDIRTAIVGTGGNLPQSGQEVILAPGTYTLAATLNPAVNTNIHGTPGQPRPVIAASGFPALYPVTAFALQISDVEFDVTNNGGADSINTLGTTFDRVVIKGDSGPGNVCQCYGGTIRNSVIVQTAPTGAAWGLNSNGGSSTETLRNDTFIATQPGAYAMWMLQGGSPVQPTTIDATNVIALNTAGGHDVYAYGPMATITMSHSDYANPLQANSGVVTNGGNNIQTPPVFRDAATGDYRERVQSTTIDHGVDDAPNNGTTDLAGSPRDAGPHTDIGAFEYQPPAAITALPAGTSQTVVGQPFTASLGATVTDAQGHPVPDITVTFTAPATGASGAFANGASVQAVSAADGVAHMPAFTANHSAGSYGVTAAIAEIPQTTSIALRNTPGPAASLRLTPQSATVQASRSQRFGVEAFDAFGNDLGAAPSAQLSLRPNGTCTGLTCSALAPGRHTVVATLGGAHASAALTVSPLAPRVAVGRRPVVVIARRSRTGKLTSSCRAPAGETCTVTGSITARSGKRIVILGRARARLASGRRGTVTLTLSRSAGNALIRARRTKRVSVAVRVSDVSGSARQTISVTLRASK